MTINLINTVLQVILSIGLLALTIWMTWHAIKAREAMKKGGQDD